MSATIVVPLPGSSHDRDHAAERALPFARALAGRTGATIHLVTVVELPVELTAYFALSNQGEPVDESWAKDRTAYLEEVASRLQGLPVTTEVRFGDPADQVAALVAELDNPLLVMASHARTGLSRTILGSVAFRIVHRVSCPVFVIRAGNGQDQLEPMALNRLLVPLDGSPLARRALDATLRLLGAHGLAVRLLHVIEPPPSYYGLVLAEYFEEATDWATSYLETIAGELSQQGYQVSWEVRRGRVAHQVIAAASERGADLIAMATHGRTGVSRLMFGSNAERVLHEATLPLLLIPPAAREPSRPEQGAIPDQPGDEAIEAS